MASELTPYIDRLEDAFNGTTWYGNSVLKTIACGSDIDHNFKLGNGNSIGQIVEHMLNWKLFVIEKIKGNAEFDIEMNSVQDWNRGKEYSKEEFITLLEKVKSAHQELIRIIKSQVGDNWLDQIVPGRTHNYRYILDGIMQHDIYHSGQIALLKSVSGSK